METVRRGDKSAYSAYVHIMLMNCCFTFRCHLGALDSCLKTLVKADQGRKCLREEALVNPEPFHRRTLRRLRTAPPADEFYNTHHRSPSERPNG